jgi:hypothetical protein
MRPWKQRFPERHREHSRCSALKSRYGVTCAQYEQMLEEHGGVCAICAGTNPSGQRLSVDHDHATGAVRGLLCHACNAGIGKLRDDPVLLRAGANYLERGGV